MNTLDSLPPLRDVIATHGLAARKSLGQNFLLDLNLTARIARAAGVLSGADVLEIGPGPGGLTRSLLAEGARRVLAVEMDQRCMPALADIARACPGRLEVVNADALQFDPRDHLSPPVKVAANLPYNVGTQLLTRWLSPPEWPPFWQSLTLMFQREVAERIVAGPGSKSYGRISILTGWRSQAQLVMDVPARAFTPQPKVNSAVVHIEALPAPRFPADARTLGRIVASAFRHRRKMLRSSLKSLAPDIEDRLHKAGIRPTDRPESVDIERFCALAEIFGKC
ncbi:MAG: 16S rRNA (adenine(1518)-N(6)/adenine(1519)-N(6))-dimethyltransferase RsmA [Boseongicola sp.]|nr:16S rRNA (adenine(1518)-N(6)/adenine(1519)-N(6))-dimethyltransferase RsmA [Boseongicola sp.]